jgi:ribonuclease III
LPLPSYAVESTSGEAHNQLFQVRCCVDALGLRVVASGPSRRRAEQAAAQLILKALLQAAQGAQQ